MHLLPTHRLRATEAAEPVATGDLGIYATLIPLLVLLPIAGLRVHGAVRAAAPAPVRAHGRRDRAAGRDRR